MRWRIAEAKRHFSELLRAASEEPQLILNRVRLVAAVVDPSTFQAYEAWRADTRRATLADSFVMLRSICAEEGYTLETVSRRDRPNAFADELADTAV